jgi:hypothetical protein
MSCDEKTDAGAAALDEFLGARARLKEALGIGAGETIDDRRNAAWCMVESDNDIGDVLFVYDCGDWKRPERAHLFVAEYGAAIERRGPLVVAHIGNPDGATASVFLAAMERTGAAAEALRAWEEEYNRTLEIADPPGG